MYGRSFKKSECRRRQAQRETEFLHLKRMWLGGDDFESIKVIGQGAFGEAICICNMH